MKERTTLDGFDMADQVAGPIEIPLSDDGGRIADQTIAADDR